MPAIPIIPEDGPAAPGDGALLCEVRVDGMVAAELGPFADLLEASRRLAASRWVLDAPEAEFRALRVHDRALVCVLERRGLLMLREMEQEAPAPR